MHLAAAAVPIVTVERASPTPLYRQVYDGYREAILQRRLRGGERLPSTRTLAQELGISRIPVLRAFEQLLAEGYCESRQGAGTFVVDNLPRPPAAPRPKGRAPGVRRRDAEGPAAHLRPIPEWLRGPGPFSVGSVAAEHFPLGVWRRLLARRTRRLEPELVRYGKAAGLPRLREAIATYLRNARAVRCEAEQVFVVGGSQQALDLVARVLLAPGSAVWIEEPNYWGTRDALEVARVRLVPVPVDAQGLDVAAGETRCPDAHAVFVTPSHQFPLGPVMGAARRLELLAWAGRSGAWIVEDDYDSEYRFESPPVASLQGLDRDDRVLYVGTFSKVLAPALRCGYIVVPPDLLPRFTVARWAMDIASPAMIQAVLADFLEDGHFARHLKRMRHLYGERRAALASAIHAQLGDLLKVTGDAAGLFLPAELLDERDDDRAIALRAAKEGLRAVPLSSCYLETPDRRGLVLGYGGTSRLEMARAIPLLRRAILDERARRRP